MNARVTNKYRDAQGRLLYDIQLEDGDKEITAVTNDQLEVSRLARIAQIDRAINSQTPHTSHHRPRVRLSFLLTLPLCCTCVCVRVSVARLLVLCSAAERVCG